MRQQACTQPCGAATAQHAWLDHTLAAIIHFRAQDEGWKPSITVKQILLGVQVWARFIAAWQCRAFAAPQLAHAPNPPATAAPAAPARRSSWTAPTRSHRHRATPTSRSRSGCPSTVKRCRRRRSNTRRRRDHVVMTPARPGAAPDGWAGACDRHVALMRAVRLVRACRPARRRLIDGQLRPLLTH